MNIERFKTSELIFLNKNDSVWVVKDFLDDSGRQLTYEQLSKEYSQINYPRRLRVERVRLKYYLLIHSGNVLNMDVVKQEVDQACLVCNEYLFWVTITDFNTFLTFPSDIKEVFVLGANGVGKLWKRNKNNHWVSGQE